MNVGLIGYGLGGRVFHAPILTAAGLKLTKIMTNNLESRNLAAISYPAAEIVEVAEQIFNDPKIDLVVITVPNQFHFPLAKQALESGKNVVVDKPFCVNSAEGEILVALASKKQLILSVYQNRRFDSDFLTVSNLLKNNELGDIVEFISRYERFRIDVKIEAWREKEMPGSGVLYDLGAHLIDQALVLFGMPDSLFADIRAQRKQAKADDYFELKLYYSTNLIVTLGAGMLVAQPGARFMINGENGSFVKFGMDVQEEHLKGGILPSDILNWGVEPESLWGTLALDKKGSVSTQKVESSIGDYRLYYANVKDAIQGNAELKVTATEALNVIKIIEKSVDSNRIRKVVNT